MLRVDGSDRVQTTQAQHHLAAARNTSPDKTRVPTLGDDRRRHRRTRPQHAGDLAGAGRPHHTARRPSEAARPIRLIAGPHIGVDQDVRWPDDAREGTEQRATQHGPWEPTNRNAATRGHPTTGSTLQTHSDRDPIRRSTRYEPCCTRRADTPRSWLMVVASSRSLAQPVTTGVCCRWSPEKVTEGGFARNHRRKLFSGLRYSRLAERRLLLPTSISMTPISHPNRAFARNPIEVPQSRPLIYGCVGPVFSGGFVFFGV
jgi:hypothetical protein